MTLPSEIVIELAADAVARSATTRHGVELADIGLADATGAASVRLVHEPGSPFATLTGISPHDVNELLGRVRAHRSVASAHLKPPADIGGV